MAAALGPHLGQLLWNPCQRLHLHFSACSVRPFMSRHLRRLQDSAHALAFEAIPSSDEITVAIMATLIANGMVDGAHARVTLTRGMKATSSMNPEFNVFG